MNIKNILEEAKSELNKHNIEDAAIICRQLLAYVLEKEKKYLVINLNEKVSEEKYSKFKEYILKIINGYPIQYIIHKQEFMNLELYVDESVLIPQPDTEILTEKVIELCKKNIKDETSILDLCTGSGAIALALKKELKDINTNICASDISEEALDIAKKNSKQNKLEVEFIESDLFENIKKEFDIIVSNPPYIKTDVIATLSKQVQKEPIIALDGGKDGLEIYRKIICQAYKYIKNGGYLCLEIGYDQKEEVIQILKQYSNYTEITAIKDLSQNDRCIIAKIER